MNILAVDIGNTNIVFGLFEGEKLVSEVRLQTLEGRTRDEYAVFLEKILAQRFSVAVVSSVVPQLTDEIVEFVQLKTNSVIIVNADTKLDIAINIDEPKSLGADRLVNAYAAYKLYGGPSLVVDFGTATTFDIVGSKGSYEGGLICAGPKTTLNSLVKATAKLPNIEFHIPVNFVGKTTIDAMQGGIVGGYACMIEGLIDRLEKDYMPFKHIIATGGLGRFFNKVVPRLSKYDESLTLVGLRLIGEKLL